MPRALVSCLACSELVYEGSCACPHCGHAYPCQRKHLSAAAVLLGLSVALPGCKDGFGESAVQSDYTGGVTEDVDGDGWSEDDGDCNDADANVHPEAAETPGDGLDANCDGADDT